MPSGIHGVLSARPTPQAITNAAADGLRIDRSVITNTLMPSITFQPTVGLVAARINKLSLDIRSFKEPLTRAIREVIIPSIERNFEVGGRPSWPPLSPATYQIAAKGLRPPIVSILVSTGKLQRAATALARWDVGREAAIFRHLPQSVWYGNLHQAGSRGRGDSRIPQRRFVMLQPQDEEQIQEVFVEWLSERVNRAWPGVF